MSPPVLWSKLLVLLGLPNEEAIRISKYVIFAFNLFKDYLVVYFGYTIVNYLNL